jgi:hypothetical protein
MPPVRLYILAPEAQWYIHHISLYLSLSFYRLAWVISLWACHILQKMINVIARCVSGIAWRRWISQCIPVGCILQFFGISQTSDIAHHKSRHQRNVWNVSSSSNPHSWQRPKLRIPRLCIFCCVASAFWQIFHASTLTFGGTGSWKGLLHGVRRNRGQRSWVSQFA